MSLDKARSQPMECEKRTIARCEYGCIDVCSTCGAVGVHLGNASVRMTKEMFVSFCRMVDEGFSAFMEQEIGADSADEAD
jgi:hypothetical protein